VACCIVLNWVGILSTRDAEQNAAPLVTFLGIVALSFPLKLSLEVQIGVADCVESYTLPVFVRLTPLTLC
jgi:hypothetical protein